MSERGALYHAAMDLQCPECQQNLMDRRAARCLWCSSLRFKRQALYDTAQRDAELLRMVDTEGLNGPRLAARLGLHRVYAASLIRRARNRTAERNRLGITP